MKTAQPAGYEREAESVAEPRGDRPRTDGATLRELLIKRGIIKPDVHVVEPLVRLDGPVLALDDAGRRAAARALHGHDDGEGHR